MAAQRYNPVEYEQKLIALGVAPNLAACLATEQIIVMDSINDSLATKSDLLAIEAKLTILISNFESRMYKYLLAMLTALGIIQHFWK